LSLEGEPLPSSRFRVEVDGLERSGATEVVLPEGRIIADPGSAREARFGPLILRRGMLGASEWYEWWARARRAEAESRRRVTIVLMDRRGADVQRWTFADAVPSAYSVSPLSAASDQPLIETLELTVADGTAEFVREA
jgi:T4-like virus tail tube protein gp19